MTWESDSPAEEKSISPLGWLRVGVRAVLLALLVFGGLVLLLALRLFERPLFGLNRPWTPYITQVVCRGAFVILGGAPCRRIANERRGSSCGEPQQLA